MSSIGEEGYLRDKAVATPLREQTDTRRDEGSTSVGTPTEQLRPAGLGTLHLQPDRVADLVELCPNKGVVAVSFSVVFDQDFKCFFVAVLRDQPSGGFGDEPVLLSVHTYCIYISKYC